MFLHSDPPSSRLRNVNIVNNVISLPHVNVNNVIHGFAGGFVNVNNVSPQNFQPYVMFNMFFSAASPPLVNVNVTVLTLLININNIT